MADDERRELYDEVERRALFEMSDEDEEPPVDLVAELRGEDPAADEQDITLGGYIAKHDRVPAFEATDGQPYTVDIDTEELGDPDRPWAAFLVFIRWAATGAGIMDHCESRDVAYGASEETAKAAALDLTLYEVRAELDAAIQRRRQELED